MLQRRYLKSQGEQASSFGEHGWWKVGALRVVLPF